MTEAKRKLAFQQRDAGLLSPGDAEYDRELAKMWGGPAPKWFAAALRGTGSRLPSIGEIALVTGSAGGIGFYVAKGLAMLGHTVILPARSGMEAETLAARDAIAAACLPTVAQLIVPEAPLDLGSFASTRAFC
jgi:NADPH:quinone reductase-like Zn-dependent oxidoreductase